MAGGNTNFILKITGDSNGLISALARAALP